MRDITERVIAVAKQGIALRVDLEVNSLNAQIQVAMQFDPNGELVAQLIAKRDAWLSAQWLVNAKLNELGG